MLEREIFYERHPDPMWIVDRDTLRFLDVNLAAQAAYGYTREEFLDLDLKALRPQEDAARLLESIAAAGEGRTEHGIWRHLKKTGEPLYAEVTAHGVEWNGRRASLVSVRDVTRNVQIEQEREALLEQESALRLVAEAAAAQFEKLFSAVPGNVLVLAPGTWNVLAISDAFIEATRVKKANFLGRELFDVLPAHGDTPQAISMQEVRASLERVLETGEAHQPGLIYYPVPVPPDETTDKGHRLWIAVNTPVKAVDGSISYILCTFEDVTNIIAGAAARGTSLDMIERARSAFNQLDLPYLRTHLDLRSAIARLAEQNAMLRTAQRLIRLGVWKYLPMTDVLTWSPDIHEMYGVPEADFAGNYAAYLALVHADDREEMDRTYSEFVATGAPVFEFAHRIVRPDGRIIHIRGVGEQTQTTEGLQITGVVQDVTAQIERDNRLHLLDQSVSRLNDVVLIFEAAEVARGGLAPVVYVNPSFLQITGLASEDVLGQPIARVMTETAPGVPMQVLTDVLEQRVSLRSDIRLFTRDGHIVPAEIDLVPVAGVNGEVTHWVAAIRDMSEKFAAEERARTNEERYELLSRSTHDVVWDWDFNANSITWNKNFRELAGDPSAPLTDLPNSWIDRLHPDDRARVLQGYYAAAAGTADTWRDEYRFVRDDGDVRYIIDRGYVMRDSDAKVERIVGSMVDITPQKKAEARLAQAEKLEALGQITGGVAHDFNNLLMIILGNTETLLERVEDPRQRRLLELVFAAALRGRDLTGRLLAFARRIPLKTVSLDLNELVTRTAELMRRTFRSNIRIETDLNVDAPHIESDLAQLELVIFNLAVNARDALREGGTIRFETHAHEENGQRFVALTVADTGNGMDGETLRRCLEPFFTTKPVGEGVGLGLSMAFGFMAQTGGKLLIDSAPGNGTRVTLLFPHTQGKAPSVESDSGTVPAGKGELVLLVEDEPDVRDHVDRLLDGLGYRVVAMESADDAIDYVRAGGQADIILSDLVMPGTADVRELARVAGEALPGVSVLYSSGYPKEMIARDGRLAADIDLLPKPYRRAELAVKLREVLDRSRLVRPPVVQAGDV